MSKVRPQIDISIVTYNSSKWLDAFFASLLAQKMPTISLGIYFRDNGSTDGTFGRLQEFCDQYASAFRTIGIETGDNVGFGQGHNVNLSKCSSDFVLITNVDLEFEPDCLIVLLNKALNSTADVASWECRQKPYEHPKDYNPISGETLWSSSACVLLRTAALRAVGGYERKLFMYGEDVELSYRLRDHGYRLLYVPKATVWHYAYEEARQIKPLQFLGSTLANVLLRCRYGSTFEVLQGFLMFFGLFLVPEQFPRQRVRLFGQLLKLLWLSPYFLATRRRSSEAFPFRMWDYAMAREGAYHPFARTESRPQPLVSVLVRTTPNCGGRLQEALTSIAAQTYPRVQLVVVEDGGDTARQRVESFQKLEVFESVLYKSLPKSGRCIAGNQALQMAEGDLLCFLDDDDLMYADHLEVLVSAWTAKPHLGAVYSLAYEVKTEIVSPEPWVYKDLLHSLHFRQPFNRALLWHHNYMPIQTVLFRRQLYLECGGFDTDLENLEDWNLWVRYSLRHDFEMVPKVTSLYRVPAETAKAVQRQETLDNYYAVAQAKHAQLKIELSPPEILKLTEQLAPELYIGVIPIKSLRKTVMDNRFLRSMYHDIKRARGLWRRIRQR